MSTSITIQDVRNVVVEALESLVLPRFDALEERMDSLEKRMEKLEVRIGILERDMEDVKARLSSVEARLSSVEGRLSAVERGLENLTGRVTALEADVKELYLMHAQLQKNTDTDKRFAALSVEAKVRYLHGQVLSVAKEAGITLSSDR